MQGSDLGHHRIVLRTILGIVVGVAMTATSAAQWSDDFADGDFTHNPEWIGMTDRFSVQESDSRLWLRTSGQARSDTLFLATTSSAAFGSWQFRFRFENVNLSNFNGARVFIIASTGNLTGDVEGYYLQFGTNNSNEIRLFRIDGDHARRRVEIGRWAEPVLAGTSGEHVISLDRDDDGRFDLYVDGEHVLTVVDNTYRSSRYFGLWIKHSATAAESFMFTGFSVAGVQSDVDDEPSDDDQDGGGGDDDRPNPLPRIAGTSSDGESLLLHYSMPMSADICDADVYEVESSVVIAEASCDGPTSARLSVRPWLEPGTYHISARHVRDAAGTVHDLVSGTLTVAERATPPPPSTRMRLEEVSHSWRDANALRLTFSEAVHARTLTATMVRLDARPAVTATLTDGRTLRVEWSDAPVPGESLLEIERLHGDDGSVIDTAATVVISARPTYRDVVINEIHYDPPDQALEFFELYNRSATSFDLSDLDYSDDRLIRSPLTTTRQILSPGEYAVFVRSGLAFEPVFPGVPYIQPSTWHVLNNSGDAVIIYSGDSVIDSVRFTSSWGGRHVSLERIDPDGPSRRANFGSSIDLMGATPGRRNSILDQNPSRGRITRAVQIDGRTVVLHSDRSLGPLGSMAHIECPPASVEEVESRDDRIEVTTSHARPTRCFGDGFIDALDRPLESFDIEVALLPLPGELHINEVMFDPLTDPHDGKPDQPYYVEIASTSDHLLSLTGVALSGPLTETGTFTRIDHARPNAVISPRGYAVFATETGPLEEVYHSGALASAFDDFHDDGFSSVLLPVRRSTLGIRRGGDPVRLIRSDSTELDATTVHPSMHHPALRITRGRSLQRRSLVKNANDPANWASSTHVSGGTPGRMNLDGDRSTGVHERAGLHLSARVLAPDALDETNHVRLEYRLRAESSSVRARIFDSRGRLVRTLEPGYFSGSEGVLIWEGHDDDRRRLPVGIYIVVLDAVDSESGIVEQYRDTVVLGRNLRR